MQDPISLAETTFLDFVIIRLSHHSLVVLSRLRNLTRMFSSLLFSLEACTWRVGLWLQGHHGFNPVCKWKWISLVVIMGVVLLPRGSLVAPLPAFLLLSLTSSSECLKVIFLQPLHVHCSWDDGVLSRWGYIVVSA